MQKCSRKPFVRGDSKGTGKYHHSHHLVSCKLMLIFLVFFIWTLLWRLDLYAFPYNSTALVFSYVAIEICNTVFLLHRLRNLKSFCFVCLLIFIFHQVPRSKPIFWHNSPWPRKTDQLAGIVHLISSLVILVFFPFYLHSKTLFKDGRACILMVCFSDIVLSGCCLPISCLETCQCLLLD